MSRHFARAAARCALLLGILFAIMSLSVVRAMQGALPWHLAGEAPVHCQSRQALVSEIAGTGQLLAAYGYDDERDDRYYVFLVFFDWTGALLMRDDRGLYCEASVLSRKETLSLAAEIEASIGAGR